VASATTTEDIDGYLGESRTSSGPWSSRSNVTTRPCGRIPAGSSTRTAGYCGSDAQGEAGGRMASAEPATTHCSLRRKLGARAGQHRPLPRLEWLFRTRAPADLAFDAVGHWATGPLRQPAGAAGEGPRRGSARVMSGECTLCFAMSEPDAGSDVRSMRTTAVRDGDDWSSTAPSSGSPTRRSPNNVLLIAVTDRDLIREGPARLSCFLVPTDAPGFSSTASSTVRPSRRERGDHLVHTDVRVPDSYRVGELPRGLALATRSARCPRAATYTPAGSGIRSGTMVMESGHVAAAPPPGSCQAPARR